ncbi:hypothetical protein [Pasteuria penetrans]|uniref:hypothetical protein n=1 Tax=Pasteuria penetrans TaxID=86005 RepID=UPI0011EC3445|nr:hypothetical protein [Pasteuria penetrans]
MRTIRSVLKSVVKKTSPETQCSCKKSRERGQKFVKIGFGSARTFLHPRCGPWIQESKLEPQRWKCKYCKRKISRVDSIIGRRKKHTKEFEDEFGYTAEISTAAQAADHYCVPRDGALTKHYFKTHLPNRKEELENRALEDAESRNGPIRIGMDDVSTRKGQRGTSQPSMIRIQGLYWLLSRAGVKKK